MSGGYPRNRHIYKQLPDVLDASCIDRSSGDWRRPVTGLMSRQGMT
jgi:hypothetical protein